MRRVGLIVAAVFLGTWLASTFLAPGALSARGAAETLRAADAAATPPNETARMRGGQIRAAALAILKVEPLDLSALHWMALTSSGQDRIKWLTLCERASRRDGFVQLQLAQLAASTADFDLAMTHLDRAWTVDPELTSRIAPPILAALQDKAMRIALSKRIRKARPWIVPLLQYAVAKADDVEPLSQSIIGAGRLTDGSREYIPRLLQILLDANKADTATTLAVSQSLEGWNTIISAGFNESTVDRSVLPYSWRLINDAEVETDLSGIGGLRVVAQSGLSRLIAKRVIPMAAGRFKAEVKFSFSPAGAAAPDRMTLTMNCLNAGKTTRTHVFEASPNAGDREINGEWDSRGCSLTSVSLSIDTLRNSTAAEILIDNMNINKQTVPIK